MLGSVKKIILIQKEMSKYIQVKVHVSDGQKENIARAVQAGTGVSIKLTHADLTGEHIIAVTQKLKQIGLQTHTKKELVWF